MIVAPAQMATKSDANTCFVANANTIATNGGINDQIP
jgi:hypothetical protein